MRRTFLQRIENHVANELFLPAQLRIPKAKFLDAHLSQKLCPLSVVGLLVGMPVVSAIKFNRKACLSAVEIEEVFSNRKAATELICTKPPVTQPTPNEFLRPCLFLPQSAGEVGVGHCGNVTSGEREEKNGVCDRSLPGPLPQERGSYSQALCAIPISSGSCVSYSELTERGDRQIDLRITSNARKLFPLPGGEGQGEGKRDNQTQPGNLAIDLLGGSIQSASGC